MIDTCSRFSAFFGTSHGGKAAYAVGYTGLGVAASRFGAQVMLGFLSTMRSDPEVAEVYRETAIQRMHDHLRGLLAQVHGEDHPDLDLLATAGPAILIYQAAVCGNAEYAEEMADRVADLLLAGRLCG